MTTNLTSDDVVTLTALAEVVIGPDVLTIAPNLIDDVDDYVSYISPPSRRDLDRALGLLQSGLFMGFLGLVTGVDAGFEAFHEMDFDERRRFLESLKSSEDEDLRLIFIALVAILKTSFYGSEGAWAEIGYEGVSVDDQSILDGHRWRPDDPSPVFPCKPLDD